MLASFGFYAKTEEAAEHSHAHCDCRIVPGFDGVTTVKGYDPDGMYERYNDCWPRSEAATASPPTGTQCRRTNAKRS